MNHILENQIPKSKMFIIFSRFLEGYQSNAREAAVAAVLRPSCYNLQKEEKLSVVYSTSRLLLCNAYLCCWMPAAKSRPVAVIRRYVAL